MGLLHRIVRPLAAGLFRGLEAFAALPRLPCAGAIARSKERSLLRPEERKQSLPGVCSEQNPPANVCPTSAADPGRAMASA